MEELGRTLKAAREEKGISLSQISSMTKINRRYLELIEAGNLSGLPGPVYVRAFLRHYARAVGLDPEYVIDQYHHYQGLQGVEVKEEPPAPGLSVAKYREKRRQRRLKRAQQARWALALVALLFVVVVGVYVAGEQRRLSEQVIERGELPGAPSLDRRLASDVGPKVEARLGSDLIPDQSVPGLEEGGRVEISEATQATQATEMIEQVVGADGEDALLGIGGVVGSVRGASLGEARESDPEERGELFEEPVESTHGVVLRVEVTETCWFDVVADGGQIFTGILQPGTVVTWVAEELLQVRFGRPEGVFLTLNGQSLGRAGTGVITREFRKDGTG